MHLVYSWHYSLKAIPLYLYGQYKLDTWHLWLVSVFADTNIPRVAIETNDYRFSLHLQDGPIETIQQMRRNIHCMFHIMTLTPKLCQKMAWHVKMRPD